MCFSLFAFLKIQMMKKLKDHTNWNTLFLNPNTIIAEMTERYKLKKSDILGPESENQAVKVALAETQIINETKEWLAENGNNKKNRHVSNVIPFQLI